MYIQVVFKKRSMDLLLVFVVNIIQGNVFVVSSLQGQICTTVQVYSSVKHECLTEIGTD